MALILPAKTTWLLQHLDVGAFALFQHVLKMAYHSGRKRAASQTPCAVWTTQQLPTVLGCHSQQSCHASADQHVGSGIGRWNREGVRPRGVYFHIIVFTTTHCEPNIYTRHAPTYSIKFMAGVPLVFDVVECYPQSEPKRWCWLINVSNINIIV